MRARKVDSNLGDIVEAARQAGFKIFVRNDELGDLDVQYGGARKVRHEVWEVKMPKSGRFTERQKRNREKGWIIWTVRTIQDVLEARSRFL